MRRLKTETTTGNLANAQMKVFLMAALIWGALIAMGWAAEGTFVPTDTRQATISADKGGASGQGQKASSEPIDFFAESSPLSKPTVEEIAPKSDIEVSMVAVEGNGQQCSNSGNESNGSKDCIARLPNGNFTESTSNWEDFGDEKKEQIVARHYNVDGASQGQDTLRIKTNYKTDNQGNKQITRELYDTVNQPSQGLITRDLIVKEYDTKGQLKKITWAHYLEIGTRKAGLEHHAVLYYEDGKLISGFANKYKDGKVVDTLLNYDPSKNPNLRMEKTGVLKWSGWIEGLTQKGMNVAHN